MNTCRPQIQVCASRFARLYGSGVPAQGLENLYVSSQLASFNFTPNVKTGQEMELINGCGVDCIAYKDCDRVKWYDIEMLFCSPDPELSELVAGGVVLQTGAAVGYGAERLNAAACPDGVSIELWAKRVVQGGTLDPTYPYAWWAWPRIVDVIIQDATFEDGPFQWKLSGRATENENWFDGPVNDWPVDSDRVFQWIPTATLPETDCGYAQLIAS